MDLTGLENVLEEKHESQDYCECMGCEAPIPLNSETAVIIQHEKQPWFDYVEVHCPSCEQPSIYFFDGEPEEEFAELFDKLATARLEYASDYIQAGYASQHPLIEEHELTNDEAEQVYKFQSLVEADDDLYFDITGEEQ